MGLRILLFSNAPFAPTGYGMQTAQAWWRIQKLGHTVVAIAANYGHEGMPLNIESHGEKTQVWPRGLANSGNDIIGAHAIAAKADIVITLYDVWAFDPRVTIKFKWVPWVPIDHEPCPPPVRTALQSCYQPIAFSHFGERMLQEAGFDPLYVPHGIETDIFKPGDKREAREKLGWCDYEYIAVMVAANKGTPSRKAFGEVFAAWGEFIKEHPKALLYVHSLASEDMHGMNLIEGAQLAGIPDDNIRFADPYQLIMTYPQQVIATLYQAADVLLSPSYGEGFGVPIVEAQACGCPVIVNDCTSMPELCFGGWKTTNQKFATPLGSYQFIPNIESILDCLRKSYAANGDAVRRAAINGAKNYDADLVAEKYWKPALEIIERQIKHTETKPELVVF